MTLTKEWLQQTIAELEEERDATPGAVNEDAAMALEAMKLALVSLEAEPVISHLGSKNALDAIVAFIKSNRNPTLKDYNEVSERLFQDNCHGLSNHVIEYIKQIGDELEELRSTQDTAPPAQEAPEVYNIGDATMRHIFTPAGITDVSDMQAVFDQIETVLAGMWQPAPVSVPDAMDDQGGVCCEVSYADGWNACRAAMLQGDEPVTTAYKLPEGWVAVPVEPTEDMIVNGFESEPDESFSDEKEWEAYDAMSGCQQAAHRAKLCWAAMIAVAPKQEVK